MLRKFFPLSSTTLTSWLLRHSSGAEVSFAMSVGIGVRDFVRVIFFIATPLFSATLSLICHNH
jgi:hypothetical protein